MHPIFEKALQTFGETKNYLECGFIIPEGQMLKFKRANNTHNSMLKQLLNTELEEFMKLGAIRVLNDFYNCNIECHVSPTTQQSVTLESLIDHYNKPNNYFSCDLVDNNRVFSKVINVNSYKPYDIVKIIKSFFSGNTPHIREKIEQHYNPIIEDKNKVSYVGQKVMSGFKAFADLFRATKIKISSIPSSPNVADTTKAGYDRLLNDIMDDYVRWDKQKKELSWAEQLQETRKSPRISQYKNAIFSQGSKIKLEEIFKFKHNDWLIFVANHYKVTNGGIIITLVVIEPAKRLFDKLKQLGFDVSEDEINLSDIIKQNNIPKELQTIIEQNSKYYVYSNKQAELWMIDRQGTGFRQYITHLTLQSYGKLHRAYDDIELSPRPVFSKLVKLFGTTKDYELASYILPDGRMLRQGNFDADVVSNVFNDKIEYNQIQDTLIQMGAIKVEFQKTYNIIFGKAPDYSQLHIISNILSRYEDKEGNIKLYDKDDHVVKHYDKTKVDDVIVDIEDFYETQSPHLDIESHLNNIRTLLR